MGNLQDCAGAREIAPCGNTKGTRKSFGSMSQLKTIGEHRPRGDFVVFINGYEVPASLCPNGSCFVDVKIVNSEGAPVSRECTVERGFVSFSIIPEGDDSVEISTYDCNTMKFLGSAKVAVSTLQTHHSLDSPAHFPLDDGGVGQGSETRNINSNEPDQIYRGKVSISMMSPGQGPVADWSNGTILPEFEKEFFLIRHGESEWNEAKQDLNPVKMMMQNDHPLTAQGILQCKRVNQKWRETHISSTISNDNNLGPHDLRRIMKLEEKFKQVQTIISSPMTRAVQTALIVCHKHTALNNAPLLLDRNLRERKNSGFSVDCTGIAIGEEDIRQRVRRALESHCKEVDSETNNDSSHPLTLEDFESLMSPALDANNCGTRWWSTHSDSKLDMNNRFSRLWCTLKYMKEKSAILVGHSNLFFDLVSKYLDPDYCEKNREWTETLKTHKIENAAIMYIRVKFPEGSIHDSGIKIVDTQMLFGTGLHKSPTSESDLHTFDPEIDIK